MPGQLRSAYSDLPTTALQTISRSACFHLYEYHCRRCAVAAGTTEKPSIFVQPLRPFRRLRRLQYRSKVPWGGDAYIPPASPYPEAIVAV